MARVVYVGGFGNGKNSVERVASAIEEQYDGDLQSIDAFPFAFAMNNPLLLQKALNGSEAYGHSAGYMAITEAIKGRERGLPNTVDAFNPPLPTPRFVIF